jgi:hypothetical protein
MIFSPFRLYHLHFYAPYSRYTAVSNKYIWRGPGVFGMKFQKIIFYIMFYDSVAMSCAAI